MVSLRRFFAFADLSLCFYHVQTGYFAFLRATVDLIPLHMVEESLNAIMSGFGAELFALESGIRRAFGGQ